MILNFNFFQKNDYKCPNTSKGKIIKKEVHSIRYNAFGECGKLNNAIFKDTTGWYYEYTGSYYVGSYWVGKKFYPAHDEYYTSAMDISKPDDEVGAANKLKSGIDDETWLKK